jgi:SAM-dependent methyltransferase
MAAKRAIAMPHAPTRRSPAVDTLALYRWAVQDPETHATVLQLMYERLHAGRTPTLLREDFAGTSAEAVAWVALGSGRRALAVDRHAPTLAWARRRAERILGAQAQAVGFVEADVMRCAPPAVAAADIISVLNFSILYLAEPQALQAYLRHAWHCLAPKGVLVLNLFGGTGATRRRTDRHLVTPTPRLTGETAVPAFEYQWEQRHFDACTRRLDCRIHFRIADPDRPGALCELRDAFCYDWRLWTVAELVAGLQLAGFDTVQVWRHTFDPSRGAQGVFLGAVPADALDALDHWTAYLVAARGSSG